LGVRTPTVRSSELAGIAGAKDDLVLSICRAVGATRYLSGMGARGYQRSERFAADHVELVYQQYEAIRYAQCHGPFAPNMSAVDLVLNEGERARALMLAGRRASQPAADVSQLAPSGAVDEEGDLLVSQDTPNAGA